MTDRQRTGREACPTRNQQHHEGQASRLVLAFVRGLLSVVVLMTAGARIGSAYSVLTHEAVIDAAWDVSLKPALLAKYPGLTGEQLREAHAYAYGGAIIQDMG
jgi:hypothetical protein